MTIAVLANDEQWNELVRDTIDVHWVRLGSTEEEIGTADGYIILQELSKQDLSNLKRPVLLNSVIYTLKELPPNGNILRINGWNGFLVRSTWEVCGAISDEIKNIFTALNKQYIQVADEPGLVAARTIAMIINEAYFAFGEEVSSKDEIDTAMKLGTNYPLGPFEWGGIVGIKKIYDLLLVLSRYDKRYLPAPLLQKEATS